MEPVSIWKNNWMLFQFWKKKKKKRFEQVPLPKLYCQMLFKMMHNELGEILVMVKI